MNYVKVVAGFIFMLLLLSLTGCELLVSQLAFHPDNVNVLSVEQLPHRMRELTIKTEDDVRITSLYLPSKNTSPQSHKLVIYFHGNGGNIYHRIPSLLQLQKSGVNVLGAEYRGYGKSEGNPSEAGIYLDGKSVLNHAVNEMGFALKNIILIGRSIGSTVAIHTAQNQALNGLILVTPLTSGKDQAETMGLGSISFLAGDAFNNIEKILNIQAPLLVIHGTNDEVIPYQLGTDVFERAKVKKELITIEGGSHNNLHDDYAHEYWLPIFRFIAGS